MKKLLLVACMFGVLNYAFGQTGNVFYYYQGKKLFVQETYSQLVVGLQKENAFAGNKSELAAQLGFAADSIKPAGPNQLIIRLNSQQQATGPALADNMRKKGFVLYVHPCLVGQGKTLVSYGDAFTVKLKPLTTASQLNTLLSKYQCAIIKKSAGDRNTYLVSAGIRNGYDALKMANTFFETGLFDYSEPDFTTHGGLIDAPNDPLYNRQWAHHNTGTNEQYNGIEGDDMQVDSAWLITKGDSTIKIAVVDTGVDTAQVDLKKNLLQGFDCTNQTSNPGDGEPRNPANAHGTACAGIVAAVLNNNRGVAGIAPRCKIIPVSITNENDIFASDFGIAAGFDYSWQHGADVLTNSWTLGLPSGTMDAAIHRAVTLGRNGKGCILFFGSGNDNVGIAYPSYNPEAVSVGGSNMFNQRKTPNSNDGEYWWGANYGGGLDVVAPCVKIATTDISGADGYNTSAGNDGDYYLTFNGTSAATPHAAAVAALVLSVDSNLTYTDVRTIIESSCTKPPAYTFGLTPGNLNGTWNNEMGYGIVNAYKSVKAAKNKKFCHTGINPPPGTLLCKNASIKLNVVDSSATATYTWRLNGTNIQTGALIKVVAPGTYDVVASFANGCTAYAAPVIIYAADTTALQADAGKPVFLCPGSKGAIIGGEPSAKGGNTFIATQRAYGRDALYSTFIRFNPGNPREYKFMPTSHVDAGAGVQFVAGDFTPLGYYGVTSSGQLSRLDTATGYVRFIGQLASLNGENIGHAWSGLTWNPADGKLYGLTYKGLANGLYVIDPITAKTTWIMWLQNNDIPWADFNNNGSLYGFDDFNNRVVKINLPGNYSTFASGDIGIRLITQLDGSFDPLNGKLYMTTFGYGQSIFGDLREIDTLTGKVEVRGGIGTLNEVGGLAISGGTYKYSWLPETGLSNAKDANPVANPATTTTYTLTVTDACGAKTSSQVVITANAPKPSIAISTDKDSICVGDSARLSVNRNVNYTYQWTYNGNNINNPNDTFYYSARGGKFQVTVANGRGGCTNTSKVFTLKDCSIWLNNNNQDTACYDYFYPPYGYTDTGFRPNQSFIKTIYPAIQGDRLRVTFNKISFKSVFSSLIIYDGPNTSSPILKTISFYDYLSKSLVYTASSGPLTFKLVTGSQTDNVGTWDAFLTCYTPHVYRSKRSGNFEDSSMWEIKTGPNIYEAALTSPTYIDDSIIIQSGHTVTQALYNTFGIDELWIQKGAVFICNSTLSITGGGRFGIIADGEIQLGKSGYIYGGGNIYSRGNITAGGTFGQFGVPIYAAGDAPQVITLNGTRLSSLHVLNNTTVEIHGRWPGDSLFMSSHGRLITDSIAVGRLLSLDSGIVQIRNGGVADLSGTPPVIHGSNALSYIAGPMVYSLSYYGYTNMYYPIGSAAAYHPVSFAIKKTTAPFGDYVKVQVIDSAAPARPLGNGIDRISTKQYYSIQTTKNYGIDSALVTLHYIVGDGVTDPANLRIARDSASSWVDAGGYAVYADTGSIRSTINFKSFSNLVLANAAGGGNALPLNWLQFTATTQLKNVLLQWKVAHEINCAFYTVEYSSDGAHFSSLARVTAYNNGRNSNVYQYTHTNIAAGVTYYRVKETDKDGKYTYSRVVSIQRQGTNIYSVTPNPAHDEITIKADELIKEIDCYNALGQLVAKVIPASAIQYRLSLKTFAAGIYTIRVTTAAGTKVSKIIKQ